MRARSLALALALLTGLAALPAAAAPVDAQVGQTRRTWNKQGTALRQAPGSLSALVATLPVGSNVQVLEVRLPWLRVQAPGGQGWLMALDTIEPAALGGNAPPLAAQGGGGVNQRDVSAVGRQFDADVERGYRRRHTDLESAYRMVDALEQETAALEPADAIAFIIEGRLGRRGTDWARPARLPPSPRPKARERKRDRVRKKVGGALGDFLRDKIGGDIDDNVLDAAETFVGELGAYHEEMSKKFTPDQEYYLGRAVAATAIARFGVDPDAQRRQYVRLIGEAVIRASTRVPANRGGYHFEVLDSDAVNAISGPGGFVLITRGAVEACASEDELAAVLCHELAHVTRQHGEKTLRESKTFQAQLQMFGRTAAAGFGLDDERALGPLLDMFDKAAGEAARNAMEASYGKNLELEADMEGTFLLADVMYEPTALQGLLARNQGTHGGHGSHTHDSPTARAGHLSRALAQVAQFRVPAEARALRDERFATWMRRAPAVPR
ncbi:MAG: M48 family metalloprotease [Planctomycetota bacterium]